MYYKNMIKRHNVIFCIYLRDFRIFKLVVTILNFFDVGTYP